MLTDVHRFSATPTPTWAYPLVVKGIKHILSYSDVDYVPEGFWPMMLSQLASGLARSGDGPAAWGGGRWDWIEVRLCRLDAGVVDVVAGPADLSLGVFQGIAQAVVETLAVELGLAGVVASAQVGAADSWVRGLQLPEFRPGFGRPLRLFPRPARMRASVARLVAPQAFSAASRISPWSSRSTAAACRKRASWNISWTRSVWMVMASSLPHYVPRMELDRAVWGGAGGPGSAGIEPCFHRGSARWSWGRWPARSGDLL